MDKLTITQIQDVLGWSYPTALAWAKENGSMLSGKWLVPAYLVWDVVQERRAEVDESESQLKHYCLNWHPSKQPKAQS